MPIRSIVRVLVVVLALVAGACGDDSGSAGGTLDLGGLLTTTSTSTTSTTASTVVSGGLFDDTGTGAPGSGLFGADEHDFEPDGTTPDAPSGDGSSEVTAFYGSDLVDVEMGVALFEACAGGDMQACDTMYLDSAPDSDAEAFGATCAGELPSADQYCADLGGAATGSHSPLPGSFVGQAAEGVESALVNACERGSMNACDALYDLDLGPASRDYGATCGARLDTDRYCASLYGLGYDWAVAWRDLVGL